MQHSSGSQLRGTVYDADDPSVRREVELEIESHGIAIRPVGYGDYFSLDGQGAPIFIEFRNGVPAVVIWDDVNNEEPSHTINLGTPQSLTVNKCYIYNYLVKQKRVDARRSLSRAPRHV